MIDLRQAAFVAELRALIDMITVAPAAALGVADCGPHIGASADLVVSTRGPRPRRCACRRRGIWCCGRGRCLPAPDPPAASYAGTA